MTSNLHPARNAFLFLAMAMAWVPFNTCAQTHIWDASTTAGYQNANGTWGSDNFWTTNSGAASGTVLSGWTSGATAWFGGNSTVAASPSGNFTITVNGTQTAGQVRQIVNGAGDFTLSGGTLVLAAGGVRADRGTFTVDSVITNSAATLQLFAAANSVIVVGGNNTYTATSEIRGAAGGTVSLNNAGALGTGSSVQFVNSSVLLDLNGIGVSGKTITVNTGQTGFLGNTAVTKSVWSGNVNLANATGFLRAGGTNAEVEISGNISGIGGLQSFDGGTLRVAGNNTYSGTTSVRNGSTLIVGHSNALGSVSHTNFIQASTLDLNGFDIGSRIITLQDNASRLVNDNTNAAAVVSGPVNMLTNRNNAQIGGDGNLTLGGAMATQDGTGGGFTKVGAGTLTLAGGTANNYAGITTVSAGTLKLDKTPGVGAIGGALAVATNAVLLVAQSNQVNDSSAVTLSGGTIQCGTGVSEVFGNLTLTAGSFLDFGTGATGVMSFGSYTPGSLLTVSNFFEGNVLKFGSDLSGWINNTNFFQFDNAFTSSWDSGSSTFTITAIDPPENPPGSAITVPAITRPHPRLFMDAAELAIMRERVNASRGPHLLVWNALRRELAGAAPTAVYTGTDGAAFYDTANRQAARARDLALAWWITGDQKYADEAVGYLAAWSEAEPAPGLLFEAEQDPNVGIYLVRGTLGFLYAADLLWDYPGFTPAIKDSFAQWLGMMRQRIIDCKQRWEDNDYYNRQDFNNHLATHALGLAAIGTYLGDRELVQFAIDSPDNARDYTDLIKGLILMPGDETHHREDKVELGPQPPPPPQQGEIYDRYRHYTHPLGGLQYAHLSMNMLAQIAEIGRHLGLDLWNYQAESGETLRLPFEYYSDFYRLGSADIKHGLYAGETFRLGKALDTPATFELGAARFPDSQPLRDLLSVTDRPLHRCHTLGPVALTHGPAAAQSENAVWDTSTDAGFQNGSGTWGTATDHFWSATSAGGTTRTAWTSGWNSAWLGGDATTSGAASPDGNFTITVEGTRTVGQIRQIQNGAGNFTLDGGTLVLGDGALRADRGTMTVNSVVTNHGSVFQLNAGSGATLILGGGNTFTAKAEIRGAAGGTVRLHHADALGRTTAVHFVDGSVLLDLNGFNVSGKRIVISAGQTGFLGNTSATKSVWSGSVEMTGNLRAGGTSAEVEISGVVSGAPDTTLQSLDGGTLRLSGVNAHEGSNRVRTGSTLIVGNASALGAASAVTFIDSGTLDLNGYDIGSRIITLQSDASRLVNDNTNADAVVSGPVNMLTNRSNALIGGDGNLTLNGGIATPVAGTGGGFTKVGTGTLTLAASSTYGGNTVVEAGQLVLATQGSLAFFIGAPGINNAVSGPGTALFRGSFLIDLAGASTDQDDSWTLVSGAGKAYDGNFQVTGFSNNAGTWSLETNGVTYQFSQSSGALTVAGANTNAYNNWASYWQGVDPGFTNTAGTADPDGDGFVNDMEFAFDGNPTVGTPALLTATKAGANAVFRYVARNSGATYEVQSAANLATGPWTNAPVTVTNSADTNNINLPADYTRKEFTVPASGSRFYRVRATLNAE